MKLRVRGDSLRLRVMRGELDALMQGAACEESLNFAPGVSLHYRLRVGEAAAPLAASFAGGAIDVVVRSAEFRQWAASDTEVSIRAQQHNGREGLSLLLEKDFPCLTKREGEDESDAIPRPPGVDEGKRC